MVLFWDEHKETFFYAIKMKIFILDFVKNVGRFQPTFAGNQGIFRSTLSGKQGRFVLPTVETIKRSGENSVRGGEINDKYYCSRVTRICDGWTPSCVERTSYYYTIIAESPPGRFVVVSARTTDG